MIKTHHNVGGLPAELGFELIEPLRNLFKDEVRQLGRELGLPEAILSRHPFPGPGSPCASWARSPPSGWPSSRQADAIFLDELRESGWYEKVTQAFAVLLPVQSVGVMGDCRTYESVIALRAVETDDFMTADWSHLPYELLGRVANRIVNEVKGVNRVVYDVTSKPPATIEWEMMPTISTEFHETVSTSAPSPHSLREAKTHARVLWRLQGRRRERRVP